MPYVVDVAIALIRVLEGAALLRGERMSGYAANAGFWASEVRHVLDVIAGHESRVARWKSAVESGSLPDALTASELSHLQKRLTASATRFFRLCALERETICEIEQLLGIRIEHVSHRDLD